MRSGLLLAHSTLAVRAGSNSQMRILRGLSSRVLPCGCLTGLYETYDSEVVGILDARGSSCGDASHQPGQPLPLAALDASTKSDTEASQNPNPIRGI
jgi:hypothetical protein